MIAFYLLAFLIAFAGSLPFLAKNRDGFADAVPVWSVAIIILSYFVGLCSIPLSVAFYIVLSASLFLAGFTVFSIRREGFHLEIVQMIAVADFILLIFINYGTVLWFNDDFSHWGDAVKVMAITDSFASSSVNSSFPSYLPGIALYQYIFERLNILLCGKDFFFSAFKEWILFFAYQFILLCYTFPIYKGCGIKELPLVLFANLLFIIAPTFINSTVYFSIMADAPLGILFGLGVARVFVEKEKGIFYDLYIWSIIVLEVLIKESGLFFSAMLALVYCVDNLCDKRFSWKTAVSILCVALPKVLWVLHCRINSVSAAFSGKIDIDDMLLVILGKNTGIKRELFVGYFKKLVSSGLSAGSSILIPYALIIIAFFAFLIIVAWAYKKQGRPSAYWSVAVMLITVIAFLIGHCGTYLYKFDVGTAQSYASYDRYISTIFFAFAFFGIAVCFDLFNNQCGLQGLRISLPIAAIMAIIFVLPFFAGANNYITGKNAEISNRQTLEYREKVEKIKGVIGNNPASVVLLNVNPGNYEYYYLKYHLRPYLLYNSNLTDGIVYDEYSELDGFDVREWIENAPNYYDYVIAWEIGEELEKIDSQSIEKEESIPILYHLKG